MLAAELFRQGLKQAEIGRLLEVSRQAVGQWHAAWVAGGTEALAGRESRPSAYLTREQEASVLAELNRGARAFGWEDQQWTLARIAWVIEKRFGARYSLPGVRVLLRRLGWSWQVPVSRAAQRDEEAIALWRTQTWPAVLQPYKGRGDGSSSRRRLEPR